MKLGKKPLTLGTGEKMKDNQRYWKTNRLGYKIRPSRSNLLSCATCGLLGGKDKFTRGRGGWVNPAPPLCISCCKMLHEEEKAYYRYLDSPQFHNDVEEWRAKKKEETYVYEGKCSSCCSPVWVSVKKGTVIKGDRLSCGCGDRGRMADNDYFRRME